MKHFSKIISFLLMNLLGLFSVPFCYAVSVMTGILDTTRTDFNHEAFKTHFMIGTVMTWMVCALFSVAYFFLKGNERFIFLLAPLVIPVAYGFSVVLGLL